MNAKHTGLLSLALLVLCSCGGGKKSQINPMVEQLDETPDYAELVTLIEVDGDSLLVQPDNDLEQPRAYAFRQAEADGQIKGRLVPGDQLSIFPDSKHRRVTICINVTELEGQWFYDMQRHRGLKFETTGGLSSINTERISFREWKLLNGKLYLYYVDMQQVAADRHEFSVDEADIVSLTAEEMQLSFLDTLLTCRRQHGPIRFNGSL